MIKLYYTIKDILNIILRADLFSRKKIGTPGIGRKLRILGNGKSLNDVVLGDEDNIDYMVVNRHVLADNYAYLKPKYYVIADPHFFSHEEGLGIIRKIDANTCWNMALFVPYGKRSIRQRKKALKNDNISLLSYNAFPFLGYTSIAHFLYHMQLAMPVVQNVLVAAIMLGIQMEYDIIELYGVEHSWTKYLYTGNDNLVYLDNPHFYDKEKTVPKPFKDIQHTNEFPMWLVLECYMKMFKSYSEIKEYISNRKKNIKIINKTPNSFIDAFDRF